MRFVPYRPMPIRFFIRQYQCRFGQTQIRCRSLAETPDADRKMTREQCLQAEKKAKETSKPKPSGLFNAFFPPNTANSETIESSPLTEMLCKKLQLADEKMQISKGVLVSKEAKAIIVKRAKEVATSMHATHHR